jgi:predicted N-acetyltransferase YhbS
VNKTLGLAKQRGYDLVLLAGDPGYYQRFGFVPAATYGFVLPGEARPERLQVLSLRGRPLEARGGELLKAAGSIERRPIRSATLQARAS